MGAIATIIRMRVARLAAKLARVVRMRTTFVSAIKLRNAISTI